MIQQSTTNLDEIIEILNLFKFDLSDFAYDRAHAILSSHSGLSISEFDSAVSSGSQQKVIQFFRDITEEKVLPGLRRQTQSSQETVAQGHN